ncbi:site-2 protease family protein [Methyloligella sp. 2.7D]|uniref:site-2 protease family protein n=1 Tax=unclassified Methyloligella TaxID=2625955 RepID=UPI00157C3E00|nr:site-2 protease family protein [Methyloligella sp. GL2]QKP76309.1 site-2 protease family protein [Methyloligella sp. GL2]
MRWSLPIGSVGGTALYIHVSFLILLAWLWMLFYSQGGSAAAWQGTIFIALVFFCVLLHELGHVFAARRFGVPTKNVTLWPFGGIASMEKMPEKPGQELIVALAGPAVNVVIAALLLLWVGPQIDPENLTALENPAVSMAAKVAGANIILVLFNLIPAFPMDGGRVLRALLAMRMDQARATQMAASIGQGFAVLFGILGILYNPMLLIIAVFVFLAASGEASQAQMKAVAQGARVSDAMITEFHTLDTQSSVNDAADALIRTSQKEFPVLDGGGHLRGVVTRDGMVKALKQSGPHASVLDAMQDGVPTVTASDDLEPAFQALTAKRQPMVGVVDGEGRLIGMLTLENLSEMMMLNAALPITRRTGNQGPWGERREEP